MNFAEKIHGWETESEFRKRLWDTKNYGFEDCKVEAARQFRAREKAQLIADIQTARPDNLQDLLLRTARML